ATGLTKPDAVADALPLVGCERRVVSWSSGRGSGDVRRHADVQRLVRFSMRPTGPLPTRWIRAAIADPLGKRFYDWLREIVSHGLLPHYQVPNPLVDKPRLDPARRAALDRDVPAEIAEHLLYFGRQHLERLPGPVLSFGADLVRLVEHPAVGTALDQHQGVLL